MYHVGHLMARLLDASHGALNGSGYWMHHVGHLMARLLDASHGALNGQATGCITWDT